MEDLGRENSGFLLDKVGTNIGLYTSWAVLSVENFTFEALGKGENLGVFLK